MLRDQCKNCSRLFSFCFTFTFSVCEQDFYYFLGYMGSLLMVKKTWRLSTNFTKDE